LVWFALALWRGHPTYPLNKFLTKQKKPSMCIAIINTAEGEAISKRKFQQCWENNTHGGGLAAVINGKLTVEKELKDWTRLWKVYRKWRNDKELNIMLHFRISTHGSRSYDNCHPFMVNKDLAFCHNGIISKVDTSNDRSDTVAFNDEYLKHLPRGFAFNQAIKQLLLDRIGYSKLVFLTSDNKYSIVGEKRGLWDGGNWFSNDSYLPSKWIDYGGIKVAKSAAKGVQKEIFDDTPIESPYKYDDWMGFDKDLTKPKEVCYDCQKELSGRMEHHYGYCTSCLKQYEIYSI
jgi:glutamine amidotransferase